MGLVTVDALMGVEGVMEGGDGGGVVGG